MKYKLFFLSLLSFPLLAQLSIVQEYFSDLLPEEVVKEQALLSQVDAANNLFELPSPPQDKKSSTCVEFLAKKQQTHFVEGHSFEDLKVDTKKPLSKK